MLSRSYIATAVLAWLIACPAPSHAAYLPMKNAKAMMRAKLIKRAEATHDLPRQLAPYLIEVRDCRRTRKGHIRCMLRNLAPDTIYPPDEAIWIYEYRSGLGLLWEQSEFEARLRNGHVRLYPVRHD